MSLVARRYKWISSQKGGPDVGMDSSSVRFYFSAVVNLSHLSQCAISVV
jgi:hypothetical protein